MSKLTEGPDTLQEQLVSQGKSAKQSNNEPGLTVYCNGMAL